MKQETIIVTRHRGLVEYLIQQGVPADTPVIEHATPEAIRGKRVIGVLPMHLAVHAALVIEVPMDIPAELRGVELTAEQTAQYAGTARAYEVQRAIDIDAIAADYAERGYDARWTLHIPECSIGDGSEVEIESRDSLREALALAVAISLDPEKCPTGEVVINPTNERGGMSLPPVGAVKGRIATLGFSPSFSYPIAEQPA